MKNSKVSLIIDSKVYTVEKVILYLTILAGFLGSAFLIIPFELFYFLPYRIFLPLLWLLLLLRILYQGGRLDLSHVKVHRYLIFLGLWLIYAILALAWSASKIAAIKDIVLLFMGASAIFFVSYYITNISDLRKFYFLWLLIILLLTLVGIWENVTGNHLEVSKFFETDIIQDKFCPSSVFHNPNDFATFIAISIPFLWTFICYEKEILKRVLGTGLLLTCLYLLVVTRSRANYLAVILEAIFFFLVLSNFKRKITSLVFIGLLTLLLMTVFSKEFLDILNTIYFQLGSLKSIGTIQRRINLIKNGLYFLIKKAGFGVGAGNAEYYMIHSPIYYTGGRINPHNWWLENLINYGIFIFAGYVLFYLSLSWNLFKVSRRLRNHREKIICEALLTSLVGFFFASLSSSSIMTFKPQWFLFAFALAFLNYVRLNRLKV